MHGGHPACKIGGIVKPSLVILAAGLGRRFGGLKQIEPVGPDGETLLEYSVFDALRAGFASVTFVIREEMEAAFQAAIGTRVERQAAVEYVFQRAPPTRTRPWGTGHAVLSAADAVRAPFLVINADDYYGASAYRAMHAFLQSPVAPDFPPTYAMMGYRLRGTLPESGRVSRAVCHCTPDDWLARIEEITGLERAGDDARYADAAGVSRLIGGNTLVSMNMWAFTPSIFALLQREFDRFCEQAAPNEMEFYLPAAIDALVRDGAAAVRVLSTDEAWCGVTNPDDVAAVRARIEALVEAGVYPRRLY